MLKQDNHIFTGMLRDISISKLAPNLLWDAHNIRITAQEGSTYLSITNERGPAKITLSLSILGQCLGSCVLNNQLILFNKDTDKDYIYKITFDGLKANVIKLYSGVLGFDLNYPIECLDVYETEEVLKVYWTDGKNLPRVINITKIYKDTPTDLFDFVRSLQLKEIIKVKKELNANGLFSSGTILYAFSYYTKFGPESNIFYVTPLYYISYKDRAGSPEETPGNAFRINVSGIDRNFLYLRIYSIQRTSVDATPIVKRILDIEITSNSISIIDTGTVGENIDPTYLLYVGGEEIYAKTLALKSNTLFLGNIGIKREPTPDIVSLCILTCATKDVHLPDKSTITGSNSAIKYGSTLDATDQNKNLTNAAGFKAREYYRCGYLLQYKTGKWSEPIWLLDKKIDSTPSIGNGVLNKTTIEAQLTIDPSKIGDYKRIRPVVVFPEPWERTIICLGVANPTLYTLNQRAPEGGGLNLYAQSSWFFRPIISTNLTRSAGEDSISLLSLDDEHHDEFNPENGGGPIPPNTDSQNESLVNNLGAAAPVYSGELIYNMRDPYSVSAGPTPSRRAEIEGYYNGINLFKIDWNLVTIHSPEIEFDEGELLKDFTNTLIYRVGYTDIEKTLSSIDIQTSSPTINSNAAGFIKKTFVSDGSYGIISGAFYEDYTLNDKGDTIESWSEEKSPVKYLVYPWLASGSLNNDISRPANAGDRSAVLKKKIISNLRVGKTNYSKALPNALGTTPTLYNSKETLVVKLFNGNIYQGNIDTLLAPDKALGKFFLYSGENLKDKGVDTPFTSDDWWKLASGSADEAEGEGTYKLNSSGSWKRIGNAAGEENILLVMSRYPVRMKYKTSPHLVSYVSGIETELGSSNGQLPIVEVTRTYSPSTMFGGDTDEAKKNNNWIPAGEPLDILKVLEGTPLVYEYGDTWFNKYDCLKTYAFTAEDVNLVVEIGTFELETHINIDGRYDANRGQIENLYMSPINFNLINKVYSLRDNMFTYKILDKSFYSNNSYPNLITWGLLKLAGSFVDPWTQVSLAATYDLDGNKDEIVKLISHNDEIYCFQKSGVSNVLFNSRVLIPTTDGVPIEISNSNKLDGVRYISDLLGSENSRSIISTKEGIFFIDSKSKHLYLINNLSNINLSVTKNMTKWFESQNIKQWKGHNYTQLLCYDHIGQDLYIIPLAEDECLLFSNKLKEFTSFMSYGSTDLLFNISSRLFSLKGTSIYEMGLGEYNNFYGNYKPYDITFICNGRGEANLANADKIFDLLDFRADVWEDTLDHTLSSKLPFDYIRALNEYLDTDKVLLSLTGTFGSSISVHHSSNLKKKFRTWRIQVPRNKKLDSKGRGSRDRMRNLWTKFTLGINNDNLLKNNKLMQLHDIGVTYFV